ncbi:GNAT family N-acetyltransferase [Halorussus sp. MSC15.2]|uniref:lipid II:glycine glycyltransferase FemX n=1 Tax=Halorussus sp. MSC15.2 TaxID=2283638 RepID=UPI0013D7CA86|nr:GNAT family N-acetyltransferase [Halorussus sp. MSC15.2]NEU56517.1 GNAT family N-acetyltransferase [Halorussus sp. MSC15.2]
MSVTIIDNDGISIGRATELDHHDWDDLVERSPQASVFHYRGSLSTQADHADARVHPLVGYKGQEPVGLLPVFETRKGGMTTAFSPAPSLWVSYLGPALLNHRKLKRRKRERRNRRFVEGCLDWVERELGPKYVNVRTAPSYRDVRPFEWRDFDIDVRHTYSVDLTPGEEDVLMSFSSDARNNIRTEGDYRVYEGGRDEIRTIISQVRDRHDEQGESYGVTPAFVTDLYEKLPEGTVRPYACEIDGEVAGGMVVLESGDTAYRWQGGAKHDRDLPVNDLVDWAVMTDAMDRGVENYDLVGANEQRLCGYKAKFGPRLRSYYTMEKGSRVTNALSSVYKKFR